MKASLLITVVLAGALIGASVGVAVEETTEQLIEIQALHQQAAVESMHVQDKADPHIKWTAKRKADPGDDER
ncbi:MAG TPA: hypothetical protein VES96_02845, partial [Nitrospiraceae bacterium]|nr:hypothetical protein [Nitrospiraceae bacterium]